MSAIYNNYKKLLSLPDISKWKTNNVTTFLRIFENCISLKSLPDIYKWNTTNVTDLSSMFQDFPLINFFTRYFKMEYR